MPVIRLGPMAEAIGILDNLLCMDRKDSRYFSKRIYFMDNKLTLSIFLEAKVLSGDFFGLFLKVNIQRTSESFFLSSCVSYFQLLPNSAFFLQSLLPLSLQNCCSSVCLAGVERKTDAGWLSLFQRKLRVVQLTATLKPPEIIQESGFLWKPTGSVLLLVSLLLELQMSEAYLQ